MSPILLLILIVIANFVIYWIFLGQKRFNEKYGNHHNSSCTDAFSCHNPADDLKEIAEKAKNKLNINKKLNKKEDLSNKKEVKSKCQKEG
ncbi:hypothetical protein HN385_05520 [archaeon]|jgi:hypothetical protein|nr:hypothetical protein [archaeon]MBT3450539.1 hypothetical protein [archaeon]MBT6868511.1 hypothetical protein [archaeon]MBT7193045.1 hypothetical protein [archaeon]MBT7381134.1 hypothetical protein [archaeon]